MRDAAVYSPIQMALFFVLVGLTLAPPLILFGSVILDTYWRRWASTVAIVCGVFLVGSVVAVRSGFRLATPAADILWCVATYTAYLALATAALHIPHRILRVGLVSIMSIPILGGYVVATIGALGLIFISGDAASRPSEVTIMPNGLVCERTRWGAAMTDSGYALTLYRSFDALPFVRRKVASGSLNDHASGPGIECSDLLSRVEP